MTGTTPATSRYSYDKQPSIALPVGSSVWTGPEAWAELDRAARERADAGAPVILVDCYPGVDIAAVIAEARANLPAYRIVDVEDAAALPIEDIDSMIARNLTDDRVFGVLSHASIDEFYDARKLSEVARDLRSAGDATVAIGWGATLIGTSAAVVVLADMARWEIQQRQRAGAPNWRCTNTDEDVLRKYKRGYFVEWRVADRHKRTFFGTMDYLFDTNSNAKGGLVAGDAVRRALESATRGPFRVVPFFDPGVWGGQWMKNRLELDPTPQNYAWCFDCVPEENSLLLEAADGQRVQIPALDLVLTQPRALLGEKTFARFGAEFPIRFDFLDSIGGGELSLQVHPLTDYIQNTFGMHYTQDESYYLLDCDDDAFVYLGVRTGVDPAEMLASLRKAARGEHLFPAEQFVNTFPVKKHDHFLIPAGTVHASGANSMVLEISATPYIFTFKLWDWGRLGTDGVPRPINVDHGEKNIQWDRDTKWVTANLVDQVEVISETAGVREERTGLHELEFIETRRHWFTDAASHDTQGTVNVLNLVEGDLVEVISPIGAFPPFPVRYAETFIVPASVGPYVVRRSPESHSQRFGTIKAYVRGTFIGD